MDLVVVRDAFGPVTDMIAIVLPALAAAVAVVAVLVSAWIGRARRAALVLAVSTLLVAAVATVAPWVPRDAGATGPVRSVQIAAANIGAGELEGTTDLLALGADVLDRGAADRAAVGRLPAARRGAHRPEHRGVQPAAVHGAGGPERRPAGVSAADRWTGRLFELIAAHVPRPWWTASGPSFQTTVDGHHRLVEQIAARAARARLPVVVAGDLNTSDRARDYRVLTDDAGLTDAMLDN